VVREVACLFRKLQRLLWRFRQSILAGGGLVRFAYRFLPPRGGCGSDQIGIRRSLWCRQVELLTHLSHRMQSFLGCGSEGGGFAGIDRSVPAVVPFGRVFV